MLKHSLWRLGCQHVLPIGVGRTDARNSDKFGCAGGAATGQIIEPPTCLNDLSSEPIVEVGAIGIIDDHQPYLFAAADELIGRFEFKRLAALFGVGRGFSIP